MKRCKNKQTRKKTTKNENIKICASKNFFFFVNTQKQSFCFFKVRRRRFASCSKKFEFLKNSAFYLFFQKIVTILSVFCFFELFCLGLFWMIRKIYSQLI